MDKYEFNIKVEQIKKLVTKGDFTTSMKIADTIDWRRVRNANLLAMISQVYEKNGEYQEAKEILMQAYERAPVGKRLLFKLAELALREGNVREAEEYYREFNEAAPGDPRQNLLRYLILKAKGASSRQLAAALEKYVAVELDERWMYELAELYAAIGEKNLCVQMCDKIALMFAFGKYVDKALALKAQFAALSDYQQDLVQNPDKYEAQYKAVEQEFENGALDVFGEDDQYLEDHFSGEMQFPDHDYEDDEQRGEEPVCEEGTYAGEYDGQANDEFSGNPEYDGTEDYGPAEDEGVPDETRRMPDRVTIDEELVANLHQVAAEEQLAREMSRLTRDGIADEDVLNEQTKKLYDIHRALPPALRPEGEPDEAEYEGQEAAAMVEDENEVPGAADEPKTDGTTDAGIAETEDGETANAGSSEDGGSADAPVSAAEKPVPEYMAIETRTPEKGMEKAVEMLKAYHAQNDSHNQTVRITGSKLTSRGVDAVSEQLTGRDLIVDEAGDLNGEELEKLVSLMTEDENQNQNHMAVVLLDNPRQMEDLYQKYSEQMNCFTRIDGEWVPEEVSIGNAVMEQVEEQERLARKEEEGPDVVTSTSDADRSAVVESMEPEQRDEDYRQEMDPDSFAQYACDYAASIDCSITGKSMLALYERVELMEEDGVPLTKENAEAMIEDAADRAEKPSLGRLITGVFSAKYNKEGLLILREEHFI